MKDNRSECCEKFDVGELKSAKMCYPCWKISVEAQINLSRENWILEEKLAAANEKLQHALYKISLVKEELRDSIDGLEAEPAEEDESDDTE